MKQPSLWLSVAMSLVAAAAALELSDLQSGVYLCLGLAAAAILLLYRSMAMPIRTVHAGMDLLRSQDFASRLRHTGQKEADEMVELYNTIISGLKAERLKNLEQESFLAQIVEASPMGIAQCSFEGVIEKTNPAFDAMASPELLGTLSSLPDNSQFTIRPSAVQILRCSRLFFMDRGFRRPFFLVERLTDEILEAETAVFTKIVRTMSHEVNNTLGGVVSVLETLAALHSDDDGISAAIGSCCDSCLKLGGFVKGYSDVVKLPDPELETVSLNEFVTESMRFLSEICPAGISLTADLDSSEPTVALDRMLIHRVLVNAVKNSVESIGAAAGHIVLRTAPCTLEIIDDGKGISEENAHRLFTPFFSTKHTDRGLGLMLISDILRRHRANFSLATGPDRLTRFSVTFPQTPVNK